MRAAVALALSLLLGFAAGWQVQDWRWEAADGARAQREAAAAARAASAAAAAASRYEANRERIRVEYVPIEKETARVADRQSYRDRECLDADGLRVLTAAVGAADPPGAGPAVPDPGASR